MHITVAKTAGFCFGVDRAVKMVEALLDAGKKVCTLGPRILRCETAPLCALSALMYAADELA